MSEKFSRYFETTLPHHCCDSEIPQTELLKPKDWWSSSLPRLRQEHKAAGLIQLGEAFSRLFYEQIRNDAILSRR